MSGVAHTVHDLLPAPPETTALSDDDLRQLMHVRQVELRIRELFARNLVHGTTHLCLGQEHVPVALAALIGDDDDVLSNHRGHGHFLAHGGSAEELLAELLGREGAPCHGVGGSQHLRRGTFASTGIQGQSLPVSVGLALHHSHAGDGRLTCVYIGDGTWGEGAVYEALNVAALWHLPLLVVVENNGIAQTTPTTKHLAGTIGDRCRGFGIRHEILTAWRPDELRALAAPVVAGVRDGRPAVIEVVTPRVGPHSKGDDTRTADERDAAAREDWFVLGRADAREDPARWERVWQEEGERVRLAVDDVLARRPSGWAR